MKIFLALLGVTLLASAHGFPSNEQIQGAILRASELNALKRELDSSLDTRTSEGGVARCPLAKFHGIRSNADTGKEQRAVDLLDATKLLLDQGFTMAELEHESVRGEFARQLVDCPSVASCDTSATWRTPDGSCNNLDNPTWGMAGVPQLRLINANDYDDNVGSPRRTGLNGATLPNPRAISNAVHAGNPLKAEVRSTTLSLHAFQMGQFLDHDVIATPVTDVADCCATNADPASCFPLRVTADNDVQFSKDYCMNFARSAASACPSSTGGAERKQLNAISSYIDASNVYGSSQAEQTALRNGAFMRTARGNRLPNNPDNDACTSDVANNIFCSLAGDFRVNTVPSLTAYHTLFVREHNRIATALQASISDPETLFQTTRRIIIGVMQKITYDEFLASFMSPAAMTKYKLASSETYTYDATIDASIDNGFGIAYRVGHTWIPRKMSVFERNLRPFIELNTEDTFENPALTYVAPPPPGLEGLSWWLSGENSPETDRVMEEAARSLLFKHVNADGTTDSFDLAALNIQRGRDHGLPSYNEFRKWCGLTSAESWTTGLVNHDADSVNRLQSVYSSPQDIDLFTGVMTERHVQGGSLGPTGECILGVQFQRLKYGDRFWYQNAANGLTQAQQAAIQQYSMSKLQCTNYNFASIHAPNAFLVSNPLTPCRDIADLDITAFVPSAPPTPPATPAPTTRAPPPPPPSGGGGGGGGGGPRPPRLRSESLNELVEELLKDLNELENDEN